VLEWLGHALEAADASTPNRHDVDDFQRLIDDALAALAAPSGKEGAIESALTTMADSAKELP
jgi:hypothetical protein